MAVNPVPDGYHTLNPYLLLQGAADLIAFLQAAFEAQEILRLPGPHGSVAHAEVRIGDSVLMMGEPQGDFDPMPTSLYLFVEDVDAVYERARRAGAHSMMAPADQYYGDRLAGVQDPYGNHWWNSTRVEDIPQEELQRRARQRLEDSP